MFVFYPQGRVWQSCGLKKKYYKLYNEHNDTDNNSLKKILVHSLAKNLRRELKAGAKATHTNAYDELTISYDTVSRQVLIELHNHLF